MDVESLAKQLILQNMTPEQQKAVLESVRATLQEARGKQKQRVSENVGMVVDALKKIEADIRAKYDDLGNKITARVNSIRDGRDGANGSDGRDGQDGRPGRDGAQGPAGPAGRDGVNGVDGVDGVSVTDAKIDFDGSLIISLSNGREINVGEVVAPDLAEKIKVITNGGGTSQYVLDTLASLQTQINNLIPSQTGNAGKFLTTNGSSLSWAQVAGGLSYQGTWNASTNTPTLTSGVGSNGYYYVVATAGSTNLNGITDWQIGDWLLFNGTAWQKIDQSELVTSVASADASVTVTTTGSAVDLAVYSSPRLIAQVRNETGATLAKGTVVYISGASGNKATVSKALATSDSTSAQTFGVIQADIANNNNGYAILAGNIDGLDTSAFAAGTQLYLSSTTAGGYTSTKQYAPNHLVYVGVVTRSHVNQGSIEVRIQNGYEMDELHNVSAQTPANGHVLIYNASTSLWESKTLTASTGISITNGAGSITIANSSPDQTVTLTGAGTTAVTGTYPNFTITSNDQYTGTVTSVTGTSPVSSSGGTTPVISLASGYGDTQNPYASKTANFVLAAPNGAAGVPTFRAIVAADIPTLNQNTTGTASNVTGTVAVANGGTGLTAGTSGGVLYYSATGTLASSAALTANALVVGGGAGTAPATITTGTGVVTALGVNTGSVGAFVVNGGALGTPSSGTVTNLTGTASININGTVGATTANTGAFTTLSATGVTTVQAGTVSAPAITTSGDTNTGIFFPAADTVAMTTGGSERARIDSSGNMFVGRTSNLGTSRFVVEADTTSTNPMTVSNSRSTAATDYSILFYRNAAIVGSVQTTLSATSYVTTSDYRLKENVQPMTGALAKVAALNPCTYTWKSTGEVGEGFIAHELAEVCQSAVTGEKDAVNEDGSIKPQGIDTSFLVATLTAAIQEQQQMIETLQAKVAALEAK